MKHAWHQFFPVPKMTTSQQITLLYRHSALLVTDSHKKLAITTAPFSLISFDEKRERKKLCVEQKSWKRESKQWVDLSLSHLLLNLPPVSTGSRCAETCIVSYYIPPESSGSPISHKNKIVQVIRNKSMVSVRGCSFILYIFLYYQLAKRPVYSLNPVHFFYLLGCEL